MNITERKPFAPGEILQEEFIAISLLKHLQPWYSSKLLLIRC
jgi:hypothetical protein